MLQGKKLHSSLQRKQPRQEPVPVLAALILAELQMVDQGSTTCTQIKNNNDFRVSQSSQIYLLNLEKSRSGSAMVTLHLRHIAQVWKGGRARQPKTHGSQSITRQTVDHSLSAPIQQLRRLPCSLIQLMEFLIRSLKHLDHGKMGLYR